MLENDFKIHVKGLLKLNKKQTALLVVEKIKSQYDLEIDDSRIDFNISFTGENAEFFGCLVQFTEEESRKVVLESNKPDPKFADIGARKLSPDNYIKYLEKVVLGSLIDKLDFDEITYEDEYYVVKNIRDCVEKQQRIRKNAPEIRLGDEILDQDLVHYYVSGKTFFDGLRWIVVAKQTAFDSDERVLVKNITKINGHPFDYEKFLEG